MNATRAAEALPTDAGHGRVVVTRSSDGASRVVSMMSRSPLRLLAPKNHGRAAWIFAATLGGGLVDRDDVDLEVRVEPQAWALVGTQASTKVYRSPRGGVRQRLRAHVASEGALVLLPDPVAPFRGARITQATEVSLHATASALVVDTVTCGRAAHGERWDFSRYESSTTLSVDGRAIVRDRVVLDPAHGALRDRMGRFDAFASVFVVGAALAPIARALLDWRPADPTSLVAGASPIEGGAVARVAGRDVESVSGALRRRFASLPELLGDDPFARKW